MRSEEWVRMIKDSEFTKDELCWIYCCGMEYKGLLTDPENLTEITKTMLEYGMNPNQLVTYDYPDKSPEENFYHIPLISAIRFPDQSAAVESLKLLLEYGGNPNTVHNFESSDENDENADNVFHFYCFYEYLDAPDLNSAPFYGLLLCAAYGGTYADGYNPFEMLIDAPTSIFKDYSRYWYEYEQQENGSNALFVVEKATGKRMARYHGYCSE